LTKKGTKKLKKGQKMQKQNRQKARIRYSRAFKQKVVSEIESGKLNQNQAKEMYGIKGGSTINCWIKEMGKTHLLSKVIRIELSDEPNKMKELKEYTRQLEKALAEAHLKICAYESYIEVAEEELGHDIKKKYELKPSVLRLRKGKIGERKKK